MNDYVDRLEEASSWDDPEAKVALPELRRRVYEDAPFDFDGNNCNVYEDVCSGWDGLGRRCNCGNRRVYWNWHGGQWHAEAY